jgi:hypothetical protein
VDLEQYQNLSVGVELVGEWIWAVWVPKTVPRPSKGREGGWRNSGDGWEGGGGGLLGDLVFFNQENETHFCILGGPLCWFLALFQCPMLLRSKQSLTFCCILRALWEGGIDHNGHQKC